MNRSEQDNKVGWPWIVATAVILAVLVLGVIYYLRISIPREEVVETDRLEAVIEEEPVDTQEDNQPEEDKAPAMGRTVTIETNKGTIKFALYEEDAPITTANFAKLVGSGFYDGLTFHRVVPGFVIQGGCPRGDGTGSSDEKIPREISPKLRHDDAGVVAMARSADPNSASCQFYITLGRQSVLDDEYAVFGRVTEGLDVVKSIRVGDKMSKVTVEE